MSLAEDIKARINILDLITRYVQMQRAGRSYKACCPFHTEKTPSFIVNPDRGVWYCFGACNEGGDIFSFLMKMEGLEFREALQRLASEVGIVANFGNQADHSRLYAANREAEHFYQRRLSQSAISRMYLQKRGITLVVANEFGIGYAPQGWTTLKEHMLQVGYTIQELLDAGLIKTNAAGTNQYDCFRNRLVIPIRDDKDRTIGFGGRALLDEDMPKYFNTSDTPIFQKSKVIYGLFKAREHIRKQDAVVIMEGYMDVIAAHQFGFQNSVACMGTSLSEDQIRMLSRHTRNYDFAMDSDSAGQAAVIRGLNQVRQMQQAQDVPEYVNGRMKLGTASFTRLWVIAISPGKDPDEIIRENPDQWRKCLSQAKPLIEYYMEEVAGRVDLKTAEGKAHLVSEVTPLIAELSNPIERIHYSKVLSGMIDIPQAVIESQVSSIQAPDVKASDTKVLPYKTKVKSEIVWEQQIEMYILATFIRDPSVFIWLTRICNYLKIKSYGLGDIEDTQNRQIFNTFQRNIATGQDWKSVECEDVVSFQQYVRLPELSMEAVRESVFRSLVQIRKKRLVDIGNMLNDNIQEAILKGEMEMVRILQQRLMINRKSLMELEKAWSRAGREKVFSLQL